MAVTDAGEPLAHTLTVQIPFPTRRLAQTALKSISVDQELSPLVRRDFSLVAPPHKTSGLNAAVGGGGGGHSTAAPPTAELYELSVDPAGSSSILEVHYRATTARMLRVAVNAFFDTLNVVVQVMEELDVDVLHEKGIDGLEGVQGVEQGMTGVADGPSR